MCITPRLSVSSPILSVLRPKCVYEPMGGRPHGVQDGGMGPCGMTHGVARTRGLISGITSHKELLGVATQGSGPVQHDHQEHATHCLLATCLLSLLALAASPPATHTCCHLHCSAVSPTTQSVHKPAPVAGANANAAAAANGIAGCVKLLTSSIGTHRTKAARFLLQDLVTPVDS